MAGARRVSTAQTQTVDGQAQATNDQNTKIKRKRSSISVAELKTFYASIQSTPKRITAKDVATKYNLSEVYAGRLLRLLRQDTESIKDNIDAVIPPHYHNPLSLLDVVAKFFYDEGFAFVDYSSVKNRFFKPKTEEQKAKEKAKRDAKKATATAQPLAEA